MMKQRYVALLNDISPHGLACFGDNFSITQDTEDADLWLVRSADLLDKPLPERLRAIARAGAGVNNIPLARCTQQGIVAFNTPGANANAVSELVMAGMLLSARDIVGGVNWVRAQAADDTLPEVVEKGKKAFSGSELRGKRMGVIGLGAIGHLVANAAAALGMEVYGFDPAISIENALKLALTVHHTAQLGDVLAHCDYISIHVPLNDKTRGMIGKVQLERMRRGVVLLNFARDQLVDEAALGEALASGQVRRYVTDFANRQVMAMSNTLVFPHLGAATEESEENCAVMAVREAQDYLNNGNILNAVNFPAINLGPATHATRMVVLHRNVPGILSGATTLFAQVGINIEQMVSASRDNVACALFDTSVAVPRAFAMQLATRPDILKVRVIHA